MQGDAETFVIGGQFAGAGTERFEMVFGLHPDELRTSPSLFNYQPSVAYIEFGDTRLDTPPGGAISNLLQFSDTSAQLGADQFSLQARFVAADGTAWTFQMVLRGDEFVSGSGPDRAVSVDDVFFPPGTGFIFGTGTFGQDRGGTIDRFGFGEPLGPGGGFGLGLTVEEAREVALLYEAGLDRNGEIDLPGLNFWIDAREGNLPEQGAPLGIEEIGQFFLDHPEFEAANGDPDSLSDRALVEQLYLNVLDREGDEAGVEFWTGVVGQPEFSRARLLYEFAVSVENADTLAFVDTLTEIAPGDWAFV